MSLSLTSFKPNYIYIQSIDGSKTMDLTSSFLYGDYFEDILSPCVMMNIQLINSFGLLNKLPVRGGEKVIMSISTAFGDFVFDDKSPLYVYKASDILADLTNEMFTLHLVTKEAITNETVRCQKRYQGNIKTTVEDILKNVLKTDKFNASNIESTSNSYTFIGNQKKPFHILTWLCPKSMPVSNSKGTSGDGVDAEARGVGGFLFYENKEGFNFKSIDSLVSGTQIANLSADSIEIKKFTYAPVEEARIKNDFTILNYYFNKNIDVLKSLRVGMYSNKTYFYDLYKNNLDIFTYNLSDQIKGANKLGKDSNLPISDIFGSSISRIMFRTADSGVFSSDKVNEKSGRDNADMAKSISRYNILFSQAMVISVPCNVTLKAGDIIYAEFPDINITDKKDRDKQQSGLYLIKELRHHFEGGQMVTSLKLIRDSYGVS